MPPSADRAMPPNDPAPRSTRGRPAKAPLSREAVVAAALGILKSAGPDAVSMRRVGQALDTGAASLYVYVSGREGLLEAMLDTVTATIELDPPDPSRWRSQLHALLERMHRALTAHPGIAAMTLADPPKTDAVLLLAENLLGILLAGGLHPQDAAWACDTFVALVHGAAREDDVRRARAAGTDDIRRKHVEGVHRTFASLPPDRFPLLSAYADQMVAGDSRERLGFAIDAMLNGLLAEAS